MNRAGTILSAFIVGGCTLVQPLAHHAPLILKPQFSSGAQTQTSVPVYSKALIHHLKLRVFSLNAGEQDIGVGQTLLNAQLDNPIVFSNLKANTSYRVRAYAYFTADDSQLISNENSYVDIVLASDDRPTVQSLNVYLIDRSFVGQASSSLTVNPGGYVPAGSEQMVRMGLEGVVASIAGSGSLGFADGTGTQAGFNQPCGLAIDSAGNLYVGDRYNHRVRKVTSAGVVTTFAGNGTATSNDGIGSLASFNDPFNVAIDSADNLYVAEVGGNRIRKITKDGVVTTIAGNGQAISEDGTGTLAKICYPHGLTVSPMDEVYFAEGWGYSNRIRKISSTGVVTTVAGGTVSGFVDGTGTAARFFNPSGLTFDKSGNLYIGDCSNNRLRKMTPDGVVTTIAGSGVSGTRDGFGTISQLDRPSLMAFDKDGNLYLNSGSLLPDNRIMVVAPTGMVSTLIGAGNGWQDGTGYAAKFGRIEGLVFDATGDLYLADRGNHRIRRVR